MSEIADTAGTGTTTVHEAYAFACMRCGHGWEQSFEIHHHVDGSGHAFVVYTADGERVPSPLSRPTCLNCGGHVVRIMKAGQVSSIREMLRAAVVDAPMAGPVVGIAGPALEDAPGPVRVKHEWRLSDLLHPRRHRT
ncbi:hypothetical protein [Streptomyces chryseus]|uniref:C2H2-type domain-containing protein n=1 Tax=Streptomyces chryseus TaxID=68186 RepID=A0ABQ3DZG7_9ACTN|nr:hypothetical protein [Streptomyces chryseus]GGX22073.1 hypothetical protein GCM10010353_41440 [Streptomyces chryseus]GHB18364.1 hypothetical protein GCM10010346_47940 [Streptomyces chryseus]